MVRLNNYARMVGTRGDSNWYEWMVFVDEDESTLNRIDHVEYLLHPTFPNPRRVVYDASSKFELRSSGWGMFNLKVRIYYKDGTQEDTTYFLDFKKTWPN